MLTTLLVTLLLRRLKQRRAAHLLRAGRR